MSVLACNRSECPNIMCDRLILESSKYICDDCWKELLVYKQNWPSSMSVSSVRGFIEDFMKTTPGTYLEADIEAEFQRLTTGLSRY